MIGRPLVLAALAVAMASLAACAPAPASSEPVRTPWPQPVASSVAPTRQPSASQAVGTPTPGASSPECEAASAALLNLTKIATFAGQGAVTQADYDAAFSNVAGLPDAVRPIVESLQTTSEKLIGADPAGAAALAGEFTLGMGDLADAVEKLCS